MSDHRPNLQGFRDLADVIAVSLDRDGCVQHINAYACHLLGYSEAELLGRNWFEHCLPDWERERIKELFGVFLDGETSRVERLQNAVVTRDGTCRIINWHNRPHRDENGRITGVFSVGMDETELMETVGREKALGSVLESTLSEIYIVRLHDLQIIHGNRRALAHSGYSLAELKSRSLPAMVAADQRAAFAEHLKPLLAGQQQALLLELQQQRRDGATYDVQANFTLSHYDNEPALVMSSQDVSERKRYARQLELAKARYKAILDSAIDAIITIKNSGEIDSFNRAAEQIFGYRAEEIIGREPAVLIPGGLPVANDDGDRAPPQRTRLTGCHKNGHEVPLEVSTARIDNEQHKIWTVVIRDLTEQVQAERVLRNKEQELQQLRDHLLHIDRVHVVNEMAASIAHEMKQPLSAISTYADVCGRLLRESDTSNDDVNHALAQIRAQATRAGEVIQSVRSLMKNDNSEFRSVCLNQLIAQCLELLGAQLHKSGISVERQHDHELPAAVANPVQIQQVVFNLITNAIDALDQTQREPKKIVIKTALDGAMFVKVSVSDTGSGIPIVNRKNVFQPFFTTKANGLGLGLSICRGIVEAHGGELDYVGDGEYETEFAFTLPVDTSSSRGVSNGVH